MALQLGALANGQRRAGVKKRVDFLVRAHESPFSASFGDTSHNNSPIVKDKVSDPETHNRGNPDDNAHDQTTVHGAHSKTGVLTRLSVCRGFGRRSREQQRDTKASKS